MIATVMVFSTLIVFSGVSSMELRELDHPLSSGTTASSAAQQLSDDEALSCKSLGALNNQLLKHIRTSLQDDCMQS